MNTAEIVLTMVQGHIVTSFKLKEVREAVFICNYVTNKVSMKITGTTEAGEILNEHQTKETDLSSQEEFIGIFITGLERKLAAYGFDKFTIIYACFDFAKKEQRAECYFLNKEGKKLKRTEKIEL